MSDYAHRTNGTDPSMRRPAFEYEHVSVSRSAASIVARMDRSEWLASHVELRERTYRAIVGGFGADIGCGRGLAVAELVERGVEAVGVDNSQLMTRAARRRFPSCTFVTASADALAEARRVIAPGGTIILADPDLDTAVVTSNDPHLTTRIVTAFTDGLSNGRAGSRGPGLLAQAGFSDITVNAVAMAYADMATVGSHLVPQMAKAALDYGVASRRQVITWMEDLHRLNEANQFLIAYTVFLTTATTPHRR